MQCADGMPCEHEDCWISLTALPKAEGAELEAHALTEWLLATIPFSEGEIKFSAGLTDQKLSDYLACGVGDPVFNIERSTWWEGKAVTCVRFTCRPGHRLTTRY